MLRSNVYFLFPVEGKKKKESKGKICLGKNSTIKPEFQ